MIRAVLDANVIVSALIRPEGPPGRILAELLENRSFALVVSTAIRDEVRRTIAYERVCKYVRLTPQETAALLASLQSIAEQVEGRRSVSVVAADPEDDNYFAAALEGEADFLVSGDRHVLDVNHFERTRVVTPRAFLEKLV